jgi:hypothetical protein
MYGSWTIKEAHDYGKKYKAKCHYNGSYEKQLTKDKEYEIEVTKEILTCSPLCEFVGDDGKLSEAHLTRFTKIEEVKE